MYHDAVWNALLKSCVIIFVRFLLCFLVFFCNYSYSCTSVRLIAKDKSVVFGRTLEFGVNLFSSVIMLPKEKTYTSYIPGEFRGRSWKVNHAIVGANFFYYPLVIDGLNEKGLGAAALYFEDASYAKIGYKNSKFALNPWEFPTWILSQFSTIDQVKKEASKVVLSNAAMEEIEQVLPLHFVVYDQEGKGIIIEPVNGRLVISENRLGVATGGPIFRWHLTNLQNYVSINPKNISALVLGSEDYTFIGIGAGLMGIPGDYSSISRFIRAVGLSKVGKTPKDAFDAVSDTFHILNHFDLPSGIIESSKLSPPLNYKTLWTSVMDLTNKRYYFHTYHNRAMRYVDLKQFDSEAGISKTVPMNSLEPMASDLTGKATEFFDMAVYN